MSRCTGHCCRAFLLPIAPDDVEEAYYTWLRRSVGGATYGVVFEGIEQIAPMVEYLGWRQPVPTIKAGHTYRCRYLVGDRDCGIYEKRPKMCREYPYGRPCRYVGCTYQAPEPVNVKAAEPEKAAEAVAQGPTRGGLLGLICRLDRDLERLARDLSITVEGLT